MPLIQALVLAFCLQTTSGIPHITSKKDPDAVRDVLSGKITEANAAWWGFDPDDSTDTLQSAIKSGAKRVIVPKMPGVWVVRPIQLASNQELVFEPGVVVAAKRGAYRGGSDTVFTGIKIENLKIVGNGATIRMNKEDYITGLVLKELKWERWFGPYTKAEWRSVLAFRGCKNIRVSGLTLSDSGGDGIYIDHAGSEFPCRDIHLEDIVCDNNYRQGMSVIGAENLTVERCSFKNTWGTPPSAGVDIEPDSATHTLKEIVFRDCRFDDNYGDGIEIFLSHLKATSHDVSIRFENCHLSSRLGSGVRVTRAHDDGPKGLVEFRNCVVENTQAYGIKVQDKGVDRARVRFIGCKLKNVAQDRNYQGAWVPIWLHSLEPERVKKLGGIDFIDCSIEDNRSRPAIELTEKQKGTGLHDVTGTIRIKSPAGRTTNLGESLHGVTLNVTGTPLSSR